MQQEEQQGSFLTGLTIGFFAGAVGYFLFATDQGKKTLTKLNRVWEEAKEDLVDSDLAVHSKQGLKDLLCSVVNQISPPIESVPTPTKAKKKSLTKKLVRFKGI